MFSYGSRRFFKSLVWCFERSSLFSACARVCVCVCVRVRRPRKCANAVYTDFRHEMLVCLMLPYALCVFWVFIKSITKKKDKRCPVILGSSVHSKAVWWLFTLSFAAKNENPLFAFSGKFPDPQLAGRGTGICAPIFTWL